MAASNAQDMLRRKQEHFNGFKAMLDDNDDAPDSGRQASLEIVRASTTRKLTKQAKKNSGNGLPRSVSDTSLAIKGRQPLDHAQLDQQPPSSSAGNAKLLASLISRHTFSGAPSRPAATTTRIKAAAASRINGKRKRGEVEIVQVPEAQQIFKGMVFYFFPNTDTNPARKMRITKAREFGAAWEKVYKEAVTHVVVDKTMDYGLLLKYLNLESLPPSTVVVLENYPAECISFRTMLDPKLPHFRVKGYKPKTTAPRASGSDVSLQLKPAGKAAMARQPETQTSSKRATSPSVGDDSDGEDGLMMAKVGTKAKPVATKPSTSEDFERAMEQARQLQHAPLEDDEGDSRPSSSSGPTTAPFSPTSTTEPKKKGKLSYQDKFQCMKPGNGSNTNNPNAATIAILDQMSHYYDRIGDDWRQRAYRKAISTLRSHPTKVRTKKEALALPQIGERLAEKIEEIAFTNRLRRLDNTKTDVSDQILQTFMGIYGVGYAQASKWVDAGFTTIDELLAKADLTANQRIGIEHYEDFNSRIPRAEVEKLGAIVRKSLLQLDAGFDVIIGGSYRRGAETSGDVDCIITHTNPATTGEYIRKIVLDRLVPKLKAADFLTAELAATSRDDGSKWHGACHLASPTKNPSSPHPWRRIDLLLVPPSELGAALIYFTGNDVFNRSLRLLVGTKGMRLNQRGLYRDVIRGSGRIKLTEGTLVEGRSERRIFEVLGVPWREAGERNC